MAVNRYFNNYPSQERINNEHLLMEDLIVESIQIMGHNIYYIPRESFDEGDMVFGEYSKSAFKKAYLIESYLLNVGGHTGQQDFFTKFGLEIRDDDGFMISRRSFRNILPLSIRQRPQEGDLIYVPVLHKMYEIKFVEHEVMFHQIGKRLPYVYELKCEAFRSSQDQINTGVEDIDNVAIENNYSIELQLLGTSNHPNSNFYLGETVFQGTNIHFSSATATAVVREWDYNTSKIIVYNITGEFNPGQYVIGQTSNTIYNLAGSEDYNTYNLFDNKTVNTDAGEILDFSEQNPFGTP